MVAKRVTALAVGLAAGKLVPELLSGASWPYELLGPAMRCSASRSSSTGIAGSTRSRVPCGSARGRRSTPSRGSTDGYWHRARSGDGRGGALRGLVAQPSLETLRKVRTIRPMESQALRGLSVLNWKGYMDPCCPQPLSAKHLETARGRKLPAPTISTTLWKTQTTPKNRTNIRKAARRSRRRIRQRRARRAHEALYGGSQGACQTSARGIR